MIGLPTMPSRVESGEAKDALPNADSQLVRDEWRAGCQAITSGDIEVAATHFARATLLAHANQDPIEPTIRDAEKLTLQLRELAHRREYHRQAYEVTDRSLRGVKAQLEKLLQSASVHGTRGGLLNRILLSAHIRSRIAEPQVNLDLGEVNIGQAVDQHASTLMTSTLDAPANASDDEVSEVRVTEASHTTNDDINNFAIVSPVSRISPISVVDATQTRLDVYILGSLRVAINGQAIERYASNRGRAVFTYLLAHRNQSVLRDVLMDVFWPDAAPASARNSLNVALHGLRRIFKEDTDVPIILFQDGAYGLNPDLAVWLDVEEFVRHSESGYKREAEGDIDAAIIEYEAAATLYSGDFLADSPYEEWTTLPREKLRLTYLDILDRLSCIHLNREQLAACVALCQLVLARDACREDVHCRLMRCYARQNQYPLAVRQYQTCIEALRKELGVEPADATTALYERVRRHEVV